MFRKSLFVLTTAGALAFPAVASAWDGDPRSPDAWSGGGRGGNWGGARGGDDDRRGGNWDGDRGRGGRGWDGDRDRRGWDGDRRGWGAPEQRRWGPPGGGQAHWWHGRWWNYGAGPCWRWSQWRQNWKWVCD